MWCATSSTAPSAPPSVADAEPNEANSDPGTNGGYASDADGRPPLLADGGGGHGDGNGFGAGELPLPASGNSGRSVGFRALRPQAATCASALTAAPLH